MSRHAIHPGSTAKDEPVLMTAVIHCVRVGHGLGSIGRPPGPSGTQNRSNSSKALACGVSAINVIAG